MNPSSTRAQDTRGTPAEPAVSGVPVPLPDTLPGTDVDSHDELFLPRSYSENLALPVDADDEIEFWRRADQAHARRARRYQDPVYRVAARSAHRSDTVLDVGCGIGDNLVRRVAGRARRCVGTDIPSAITVARDLFPDREWIAGDLRSEALWSTFDALDPDLVICADVIEHVEDPILFLERLRWLLAGSSSLVLSTPDRSRIERQPALGPPADPTHIREWTEPEMTQLLRSTGFSIRSSRHVLTRRYPVTVLETKMVVWRALHRRAVPGPRSTMVFELTAT